MKRLIAAAVAVLAVLSTPALADTPGQNPFANDHNFIAPPQ